MTDTYGIDFGTTNSVLARANPQGVEAIALDRWLPGEWAGTGFDRLLPSVIGFAGGRPTFGWRAKRMNVDRLEAVKRLFATDDTVRIGPQELKVEEAAAMFFRHMQQEAAGAGLAARLDRAVVTIPANSRGVARYRTKLSAGLAGIEVTALINEPTAAAMAHARQIGQDQRILVFDWGGGTLDVTVLQSYQGTFIEQASKGIQRLGGLDVDQAVMDALVPELRGAQSWGTSERNTFRLNLERAKVELSSRESAIVEVPRGGHVELTRQRFERIVQPLIERTREPVEVCLRESPGRIDHLVMVGGSSKMPVIERFVSGLVGVPASRAVDPMTAIAEGAAIAAGILQGTITDLDFHVGTEHALGTVVAAGGGSREKEFSVLIRRNTKYPARATDGYVPALDFQEEVNIQVIEGDPAKPIDHEDNVIIKDWNIPLPEPRPIADAAFTITYEYDVDGILHVIAEDTLTGALMMNEEVAFGAATDKSRLPAMRRRVDGLMGGADAPDAAAAPAGGALSPESLAVLRKATEKVLPFVVDADRAALERLVGLLRGCAPHEEAEQREALDRELRKHAYLL
ncbi:MAG TPA: Hsp70 family protein [Spirillospora sp.]|nr:Hsp70 family protein [Spirillospora sp.]